MFCRHGFGLLRLLRVALQLTLFWCDQSVPNELNQPADLTCSFKVSFFRGHHC